MLLQMKEVGVVKNDEERKIETYVTMLNGFHFDYLIRELARKGASPYCDLKTVEECCCNHYLLVYVSIKDRLIITYSMGDVSFVYCKSNLVFNREMIQKKRFYNGIAV